MNQLVFIKDGKVFTDSIITAKEFGKDHRNVLRDIEIQLQKLTEAGEKEWGLLNFEQTQYQHNQNKQWYTKYDMTEEAFAIIAMSYITPEAMKMKVRFIEEFKQLRQQLTVDTQGLSPILQFMIRSELEQKALKKEVATLHKGLDTLTVNLTAVPEPAKVKELINEYQRWTRLEYDEIYNSVYGILLERYGLNIPRRVENERQRIDAEYFERKGRHYKPSTLKSKVTGIDVMVRMEVLDKFTSILSGLLTKAKSAQV